MGEDRRCSTAIVIPVTAPAVTRLASAGPPSAIHHRGKSGSGERFASAGPCSWGQAKPVKATQQARSLKNGHAVTVFSSSQDGTFEVELPAGPYLIEQSVDQMGKEQRGFLVPAQVVVPKNDFVGMSLLYDNGMRLPC
jgi:hypothetical protein